MATKTPKLTTTQAKKIREALTRTLTALDPKIVNKIARGVDPRVAAVDVNVCGSKCF